MMSVQYPRTLKCVDIETGEIKFDKYIAVDDCGNVINPMLVEGQVHGGIVQGMAQASSVCFIAKLSDRESDFQVARPCAS